MPVSDDKIAPYDEGSDSGGDVAGEQQQQRNPDTIQREIEQARAELADTIDAIADRISPKRAAPRGAQAVKSQVSSVFGGSNGGGSAPAAVLDAPPTAASHVDSQQRARAVESVARSGGGAGDTRTPHVTLHPPRRARPVLP